MKKKGILLLYQCVIRYTVVKNSAFFFFFSMSLINITTKIISDNNTFIINYSLYNFATSYALNETNIIYTCNKCRFFYFFIFFVANTALSITQYQRET